MILHIITGLNDGGAEGVLSRLCLAAPHQHKVISLMGMGKYGDILRNGGVEVHCLNINTKKLSLFNIFKLYQIIKEINPTIVQTWMYHGDLIGGVVAKIAGVPNIFWGVRHSNLSKGNIKTSTYVVMKSCAVLSYFIPKKIITCSRAAIKTHEYAGYNKKIFELIQNGYDLSKFKPFSNPFDKIIFTSKEVPIIAMVARFDVQKDHSNLIKAFSMLKNKGVNFHLVLVGTAMEKNNSELVQMINNSNLIIDDDVSLYGTCGNIPMLMNSIDIHVLSSLGEAFPNVLAESMACGTPCVSTDVGDAKEIVRNYGWIVPREEPKALSEAIESALYELTFEPEKWKKRKRDCIIHIRNNFDLYEMITKFYKVWDTV